MPYGKMLFYIIKKKRYSICSRTAARIVIQVGIFLHSKCCAMINKTIDGFKCERTGDNQSTLRVLNSNI